MMARNPKHTTNTNIQSSNNIENKPAQYLQCNRSTPHPQTMLKRTQATITCITQPLHKQLEITGQDHLSLHLKKCHAACAQLHPPEVGLTSRTQQKQRVRRHSIDGVLCHTKWRAKQTRKTTQNRPCRTWAAGSRMARTQTKQIRKKTCPMTTNQIISCAKK